MAAQAWYDDPITQSHATDDGVDLGTPNNTALTMPYGGQVIDASYHVYGGQVVVHMPSGWDEYFIHLNNIDVQPGEQIEPGQEIGTSGGGVGDLIMHNGAVTPALDQSWYEGHSSGYHSEYGEFRDTSAAGDLNQFNQGWGNKARQLDPTGVIQALRNGSLTLPAASSSSSSSSSGSPTSAQTLGFLPGGLDPSKWPAAIASGMGFSSPQNMLQRLAVGGAGVGLCFLGIFVAFQPEAQAAVANVQQQATKAAGAVAKAAAA